MTVTEHELKERAAAPRVTLEQVNETIVAEYYFTAGEAIHSADALHKLHGLDQLTFCVLVLKNGYTVTGKSACADPANYKQDIGERIARQDAVNQIWPLLGYQLKTELAQVHQHGERVNARHGD